MSTTYPVTTIDLNETANNLRRMADEVEKGTYVVIAFAGCDKSGDSLSACAVDSVYATPDLLDAIVHDLKTSLWESYEA
jgi:hypothetical protein